MYFINAVRCTDLHIGWIWSVCLMSAWWQTLGCFLRYKILPMPHCSPLWNTYWTCRTSVPFQHHWVSFIWGYSVDNWILTWDSWLLVEPYSLSYVVILWSASHWIALGSLADSLVPPGRCTHSNIRPCINQKRCFRLSLPELFVTLCPLISKLFFVTEAFHHWVDLSKKYRIFFFNGLLSKCLHQGFHHASLLQIISKLVCTRCFYKLLTLYRLLWSCGIGIDGRNRVACSRDIWLW